MPVLNPLDPLITHVTEVVRSGGSYVSPGNRILLQGLALSLRAQAILETGYDTGCTTMALAMTGAKRVVAVENHYEHPWLKVLARHRLAAFPSVELVDSDALVYLLDAPDEAFDLLFIDDCHDPVYLAYEIEEACRIVRPGGYLAFHDTLSLDLEAVVREKTPRGWDLLSVPCIQGWDAYSGDREVLGYDFGLMLVRRPLDSHSYLILKDLPPPLALLERSPLAALVFASNGLIIDVHSDRGFTLGLNVSGKANEVTTDETIFRMAAEVIHVLRAARLSPVLQREQACRVAQLQLFVRGFGSYCSVLASRRGTALRASGTFGQKVATIAIQGE